MSIKSKVKLNTYSFFQFLSYYFQRTNYLIDIAEHVEVPAADSSIFTFLASGDFDIKIEAKDKNGPYACVEIKFSVKPF